MQELADCLNIKIALAHNYQEYLEFTRDSFWEKNNKKKKKMRPSANREGPLLLFVLFFAYRARSKGTIIRMYKYRRILEWLEKQAIKIEDIPAVIEMHGGVEKLYGHVCQVDPRRRTKVDSKSDDGQSQDTASDSKVETASDLRIRLDTSFEFSAVGKDADRLDSMHTGMEGLILFRRTWDGFKVTFLAMPPYGPKKRR